MAGAKHPHAVGPRTDRFCLGKFFCSRWKRWAEQVSVLVGGAGGRAGPADRGGPSGNFFARKDMPIAEEGCLRGSGAPLIFFVRHVKKSPVGSM